jgi:FKBP-type peptidyl-prolyl cis-trans isomerase
MTLQENKGKGFIYIIPVIVVIGIVYLMLYRNDVIVEPMPGTSPSEEIITEQSDKVAIEEAAAPIAKEINKENKQKIVMNTLEEGKTYTTESGLQYEVMTLGTGATPQSPTDVVEVHYHGTLENGTVFDSSVERDEKISFPLDRVISG